MSNPSLPKVISGGIPGPEGSFAPPNAENFQAPPQGVQNADQANKLPTADSPDQPKTESAASEPQAKTEGADVIGKETPQGVKSDQSKPQDQTPKTQDRPISANIQRAYYLRLMEIMDGQFGPNTNIQEIIAAGQAKKIPPSELADLISPAMEYAKTHETNEVELPELSQEEIFDHIDEVFKNGVEICQEEMEKGASDPNESGINPAERDRRVKIRQALQNIKMESSARDSALSERQTYFQQQISVENAKRARENKSLIQPGSTEEKQFIAVLEKNEAHKKVIEAINYKWLVPKDNNIMEVYDGHGKKIAEFDKLNRNATIIEAVSDLCEATDANGKPTQNATNSQQVLDEIELYFDKNTNDFVPRTQTEIEKMRVEREVEKNITKAGDLVLRDLLEWSKKSGETIQMTADISLLLTRLSDKEKPLDSLSRKYILASMHELLMDLKTKQGMEPEILTKARGSLGGKAKEALSQMEQNKNVRQTVKDVQEHLLKNFIIPEIGPEFANLVDMNHIFRTLRLSSLFQIANLKPDEVEKNLDILTIDGPMKGITITLGDRKLVSVLTAEKDKRNLADKLAGKEPQTKLGTITEKMMGLGLKDLVNPLDYVSKHSSALLRKITTAAERAKIDWPNLEKKLNDALSMPITQIKEMIKKNPKMKFDLPTIIQLLMGGGMMLMLGGPLLGLSGGEEDQASAKRG